MINLAASLALPLLRLLPAEQAHDLTLTALRLGLGPSEPEADDPILAIDLWGRRFANPVGLAAGFDKNAAVPDQMLRCGFGFVEIGTVTPRPQAGNPRPRLFRLASDGAVINRMGFNNDGLEVAAARLGRLRQDGALKRGLVGANVGKNRDAVDVVGDYVRGVTLLGPHADYLVINVSSPNTPGLRALQKRSEAAQLMTAVLAARDRLPLEQLASTRPPPVLLKIAPDLDGQEVEDIAQLALDLALDGLIVSNTTTARPPDLLSPQAHEPGGLSGRPLLAPSTRLLATLHDLTRGRIPLIGVGGIASAEDAYAKIRAGASLIQLYTALVYQGPGLVRQIKTGLAERLRQDGFTSLAAAVGSTTAPARLGLDRQGV